MRKSSTLQKAKTEEWLGARGCQIVSEDQDTVYVKVDLPCPHLVKSDDGWACDIYHDRPDGCREFDGSKYSFLKCRWKSLGHVVDESTIEKARVQVKAHQRKGKWVISYPRWDPRMVGVQEGVAPYGRSPIEDELAAQLLASKQSEVMGQLAADTQGTIEKRRETNVSATYSFGNVVRQWNMEARSKYSNRGNLGNIGVREVIQNSLDAVVENLQRGKIKKGRIDIAIQRNGTGYDVIDNGTGMSAEDIRDKFLALGGTGKDVSGRFGGFGIAKAVILGPTEQSTWELSTNDFYFDSKLSSVGISGHEAAKVQYADKPMIGTHIAIRAEQRICTNDSKMYAETTEVPKNVAIHFSEFNEETGEQMEVPLKDPFKRLKFDEKSSVFSNGKTKVTLRFYPRSPPDYREKQVIRLVDEKTGSKLTQSIASIYGNFKGCLVVDVSTTETPGSPTNEYPLTDSRMNFKYGEIDRFIANEISDRSQEKLSSGRVGIEQKMYSIKNHAKWNNTLERIAVDPEYAALTDEINKAFDDTNLKDVVLAQETFTPLQDVMIEQDVGYRGTVSGSVLQAKVMTAFEGLSRLYSLLLNKKMGVAKVKSFIGILPKPGEGGSIKMAHFSAQDGEIALNFKDFPKSAFESPVCLAQSMVNMIQHELTHSFVAKHNEDFTGTLFNVQEGSASLFPHALAVSSAVLGQKSEMTFSSRGLNEKIPVNKRPYNVNSVAGAWKKKMRQKYMEAYGSQKMNLERQGISVEEQGGPRKVVAHNWQGKEIKRLISDEYGIPYDRVESYYKDVVGWQVRLYKKEQKEMQSARAADSWWTEKNKTEGEEHVEPVAKSGDSRSDRQSNRDFQFVVKLG